jgi:hypothetical protein
MWAADTADAVEIIGITSQAPATGRATETVCRARDMMTG